MVKNQPSVQETQVPFLGWEDALEKGMATRSNMFAWKIPCTEEPGGLQSMGSQRVDMTEGLTHNNRSHMAKKPRKPALSTVTGDALQERDKLRFLDTFRASSSFFPRQKRPALSPPPKELSPLSLPFCTLGTLVHGDQPGPMADTSLSPLRSSLRKGWSLGATQPPPL